MNPMERLLEQARIIDNTPELKILNVDQLRGGVGAKFLECIRGQNGELIAKQWRRKIPERYQIIVRFQ